MQGSLSCPRGTCVPQACTRQASVAVPRVGLAACHHTHTPARVPHMRDGMRSAGSRQNVRVAAAVPADPPRTATTVPNDAEFAWFSDAATRGNVVPIFRRLMSDQLTPVTAYRCLVREDDRDAPSFLFESVANGVTAGRYSFVGAHPARELLAKGTQVTVLDHVKGTNEKLEMDDPMEMAVSMSRQFKPVVPEELPDVFTGGFVGYAGYDTVRYVYNTKLPFETAPEDDRGLLDMHFAMYNQVVVFDQASKLVYAVNWVHVDEHASIEAAYSAGLRQLSSLVDQLDITRLPQLPSGRVDLSLSKRPEAAPSNMSKQAFLDAVDETKEHIQAGDIFQLVLSHRFERRTYADPFEVYRALRVVNPSPYMTYLQARGCIIVASSPEILCRVDQSRVVTNRPLAGTRPRGKTEEEDQAWEKELLADPKETSEHVMLVDLGRNDVGKVSKHGTVTVDKLMEIERYSHVMHISSTVTGSLLDGLDCWDALRAALPAGTVSGAPKVRAMQIIDELEVNQRGPYGGGFGHVSFGGNMDMALALRTMVVPTNNTDYTYSYEGQGPPRREWCIHLQAGAGVVADSVPESEYEETVNKSAALGRAVDLAESAFIYNA